MDALPANEHLQIVALCKGFVSRSPTKVEAKAYELAEGFPIDHYSIAGDGDVGARLYHLKDEMTETVVPMEPASDCEIAALDEAGKPIFDVFVLFSPNAFFPDYGPGGLGNGMDMLELIRERLAAPNRPLGSPPPKFAYDYGGSTNGQGILLIRGLPVGTGEPNRARKLWFQVGREGYELDTANVRDELQSDGELAAEMYPGKPGKVVIRMKRTAPEAKPDE